MSQGLGVTINRLPVKTWNWLGMNEAVLERGSITKEGRLNAEIPETVIFDTQKAAPALDKILTGMGDGIDTLFEEAQIPYRILRSTAGMKIEETARLRIASRGNEETLNRIGLFLEKDSEMTVVMDVSCMQEREKQAFAGFQTRIYAEENARLHLVQVQRLGEAFTCFNDVGIFCKEGAKVELLQLILGGGTNFYGARAELSGKESAWQSDIGYLLRGGQRLDMNYVALHEGKKTNSKISVSGVLRDRASKLFRGTIDFQTGCGGSEGEETEDVLLLDDTVVNRTIPLILCGEEDVQGNHGATIGRLDEKLLFYLQSRGICREEVYEMMARARIDALNARIPDAKVQAGVQSWLEGGNGDECQ
ncbi:MAG: SufD family Fe-S cluster assembly protein [Eubacteriales bacterium]|nr:SufD family Fe-S cluster assembly protein [Eubacteriales bacterium]